MQFTLNPALWLLWIATIAGIAAALEPQVVDSLGYSPRVLDFFTPGIGAPPPAVVASPGPLPVPPAPPPGAVADPQQAMGGGGLQDVAQPISRQVWESVLAQGGGLGPDGCFLRAVPTTRPEGRSFAPTDWDPALTLEFLVVQGELNCVEYKFTGR